jgi:nucleotide-binding universal stress UspA family protein
MKILVYCDGSPLSERALHFAARLVRKLEAQLAVITIRSGTHAIEPPPPFGADVDLADTAHLPPGLQVLAHAAEVLCAEGLLDRDAARKVMVRELPHGHLFTCKSKNGKRIPFYVCFGHMIEALNHETDKHGYDLLVIAPPRRGRLHRMVLGDTTRKLVLDLHTSVLVVREGRMESRYVICVDGSTAATRQLGMLERFLPTISGALEVIWVRTPDCDADEAKAAEAHLLHLENWLTDAGRHFDIIRAQGLRPADVIAEAAGDEAVIFLGASLRHDVYRRIVGSLPMQVLARTSASVLLVKGLPEGDPQFLSEI